MAVANQSQLVKFNLRCTMILARAKGHAILFPIIIQNEVHIEDLSCRWFKILVCVAYAFRQFGVPERVKVLS